MGTWPTRSLLRIIKRWRRYEQRGAWNRVPPRIRGLYVLYQRKADRRGAQGLSTKYEVVYIGIAGKLERDSGKEFAGA